MNPKKIWWLITIVLIVGLLSVYFVVTPKSVDVRIITDDSLALDEEMKQWLLGQEKIPDLHIHEVKNAGPYKLLLAYSPKSNKNLYVSYDVQAQFLNNTLKIYITEKPASTESAISTQFKALFEPPTKPSSLEIYINGQKQPFSSSS